jgi:TRAP-type uncharacterized transport system fused permease subunit
VTGRPRGDAALSHLTYAISLVMFGWLVWYFYTGRGGPSELACYLVPIALTLQILFRYREGKLYEWLPTAANRAAVVLYIGICIYAFAYFWVEYEQIAIYRQGSYTTHDFVVGLLVFLLVMELSRLIHTTLFWVNVILIGYTIFGYLSPFDFFWHPGTSFHRVVTSSTVELATGIYGLYSQLALTVIAAFLLLAAAARGFGAQEAMVNVMRRLAGRSRHTISADRHLASVSVGLVSGSGAANTAVTGSFTIPLMMRYGFPGHFAGAVETRGVDGRTDDAAPDGGGRVPYGRVHGRPILGGRAEGLCDLLRLFLRPRAVRLPARDTPCCLRRRCPPRR